MAAIGPKMADGVWKGVYSQVFGHFKQLSISKFFDPSTPSMTRRRKNNDRRGTDKQTKEKDKNRRQSTYQHKKDRVIVGETVVDFKKIKKQKKEIKEKSWLLYREYKDFLEEKKELGEVRNRTRNRKKEKRKIIQSKRQTRESERK